MVKRKTFLTALGSFAAVALLTSPVSALTFVTSGVTSDGDARPVSAIADITDTGANEITVQLSNTTTTTISAGQLLTGLDIALSGVTGVSLTSATGVARTIAADGSFVDSGVQNLSWSIVDQGGGVFRLNFNPDAEFGIVGPPTGGDYSAANGSITGNSGHNPFTAEVGTFVIAGIGLDTSAITGVTFLFGTDFRTGLEGEPPGGGEQPPVIPEPASVGLLALAVAGLSLRVRRMPR